MPSFRIVPSVLVLVLLLPGAEGSAPPPLPFPVANAAAVAAGDHIYLVGGQGVGDQSAFLDSVLRFDPRNATLAEVAKLPTGRMGAGAVWTGSHVVVVGGSDRQGPLKEIFSFDPLTNGLVLAARLPHGISNPAVAWDGSRVLVFGGFAVCGEHCVAPSAAIHAFDPASRSVDVLSATLPSPIAAAAAFRDGDSIYLLGGLVSRSHRGEFARDVVRFDLATGTATRTEHRLPRAMAGAGVVASEGKAILFGGEANAGEASNAAIRFTPSKGDFEEAPGALPAPRSAAGVALSGERAYVLGGIGCAPALRCDTILPVELGSLAWAPMASVSEEREIPWSGPLPVFAALAGVGIRRSAKARRR